MGRSYKKSQGGCLVCSKQICSSPCVPLLNCLRWIRYVLSNPLLRAFEMTLKRGGVSNPYTNLPKWNFWRNAVEGVRSAGLVENIWTPKFGIGRDDLVVTAGSCFAQHISRYLKSSGFSWVDSEPAPDSMDDEEKRTQGYGVFSFRTGNIYTPTLLEQWIDFALGKRSSEESEYFFDNGLFFDLLRPALNPGGYASLQDAVVARDKTLECMRRSLASANTFIFTLGLTEAWLHKCGTIYPVCPGTIKGDFNPDLHYFHNYDYSENFGVFEACV
ncbi:hypothetical protein Q3H58_000210 [Pseudomonas psychrotolerans]|nr:hypothetical protein [Pseudomonas psychrotolerans]